LDLKEIPRPKIYIEMAQEEKHLTGVLSLPLFWGSPSFYPGFNLFTLVLGFILSGFSLMAGLGKACVPLAPRDWLWLQSAYFFLCLIYTKSARASRKVPGQF
jgi:hypothetical protein